MRMVLPAAIAVLAWWPGSALAGADGGAASPCSSVTDCLAAAPLAWMTGLILGVLLASVGIYIFQQVLKGSRNSLAGQIKRREWPVLISRRDGHVLAANSAMTEISARAATVHECIGPVLGVTAPEIYRMSRQCLRDGLTLGMFYRVTDEKPVALTVQQSDRKSVV